MSKLLPYRSMGAEISDDGRYRYSLTRVWDDGDTVAFIGLNPSTADAMKDDPTIRRCVGFAQRWGFGGLVMLNLFAFRATDPKEMVKQVGAAIGPENDKHLTQWAKVCPVMVAAWGTQGAFFTRNKQVVSLIVGAGMSLHCFGKTDLGFPKHPLYLPNDAALELFESCV